MPLNFELPRLIAAAGVIGGYGLVCAAAWLKARGGGPAQPVHRQEAGATTGCAPPLLVAWATQTGFARELAARTTALLHASGIPARAAPLSELDAATLCASGRILFVVSTHGEGDPPDGAAGFARTIMNSRPHLRDLRYGMLALGDRRYGAFCGFGRRLDRWLDECGARALFERIEVDAGDESALRDWHARLTDLGVTSQHPPALTPPFRAWRLTGRRLLNPGSTGWPTYHVELECLTDGGDAAPCWEAGDLLEILVPGPDTRPRAYSIASLPSHGRLQLLVRQVQDARGEPGLASGWLTCRAGTGTVVTARLRRHDAFRLGSNADRPLILVGNGVGLAGLLAHLRQRAAAGEGRNWLIFGERQEACDHYHRDEIGSLQSRGLLTRCDAVFSRDGGEHKYVQHRLADAAETVRQWVADGAAIYVSGSAEGMAPAVDATLTTILGDDALAALKAGGRYRRDVY